VRRACARWSSSTHGCVCACRSPGRGWRVESAEPTAGACPCASARRFLRSASEQCSRVGGHTFVLFTAMSPTRDLPGKAAWGTSSGTSTGTGGVHNREHGAHRCRCMWANSDMRGGGKLPPPRHLRVCSDMPRGQSWVVTSLRANPDGCGGAKLAPPRDLGFYRTTDAPLARPGLENKPDNNGSAKLAGPYDLGRCSKPSELLGPGVDVGVGHRLPRQDNRHPIRAQESDPAPRSRQIPRNKPDKCGPADLAGPYDLGERPGAHCWIYPVHASM
jgi:hypothetical protein